MTWAQFKAAVIEELGVDGTRRGIDALRTRSIRDCVVDLQRYIRAFRTGHTTTYQVADLTAKDWAHLGTLPDQAKPKAFYIVSVVPKVDLTLPDPNCARNRLDFYPWDCRQHMICDRYGVRNYQYAISPFSRQFLVHPLVNDETYLLVVWDGIKMTFADGDTVPWPEQAAEAVAAYVKWKIILEVDKRLDLAREWFDRPRNQGIYPGLRLALFREQNEAQEADGKDEEYDSTSFPNPAPLSDFGAQQVPFLATVVSVAGMTNTALANIPTVGITPNFAVEFLNATSGAVETWILQVGTDASDGTAVQRPNDYTAGVPKCWYKQSI